MRHFKTNMRHKCDTAQSKVAHRVAHRKWLTGINSVLGTHDHLDHAQARRRSVALIGRQIDRFGSVICAAPGMHKRWIA
jgi:hypothetical protein